MVSAVIAHSCECGWLFVFMCHPCDELATCPGCTLPSPEDAERGSSPNPQPQTLTRWFVKGHTGTEVGQLAWSLWPLMRSAIRAASSVLDSVSTDWQWDVKTLAVAMFHHYLKGWALNICLCSMQSAPEPPHPHAHSLHSTQALTKRNIKANQCRTRPNLG